MFNPDSYALSLQTVPTLIAMLAILLLGLFGLLRERVSLVSISFFVMTLTVSIWLFAVAWVYSATDERVAHEWARVSYLGIPFIAPAVYWFSLVVLGIQRRFAPVALLAWLGGLFFSVAGISTDALVKGMYLYPWGYYTSYGWLGIPFITFFSGLLLASLVHYWRGYRKSAPGTRRQRIQALMLAFGIGYTGAVDFVATYGIELYPFGYLSILGFVALAARAIFTYHLVDITPAFAANKIVDTMSDALLVLDREGVLRVMNRAASELFGYTSEELVGKPIAQTINGSFFTHDLWERLGKGIIRDYEMPYVRRDGALLTVCFSSSVMRDKTSNPVAIVCTARDITEEKRTQEEIRQLNETLEIRVEERTAELQAANIELEREIEERARVEKERTGLLEREQVARVAAEEAEQRLSGLAKALDRALAEARLLNAIAAAASGEADLNRILNGALDQLSNVISFTGGSIVLVEEDDAVVRAATGPFTDSVLGSRLPRGRGKTWQIISDAKPFLCGDLLTLGLKTNSPVRSFLAVPLVWRGSAFGLLEVDSLETDAFNDTDLELMENVAAALSGPIQLAKRYAAEVQAVEDAQAARNRLALLSEVSKVLAASLDSDSALEEMSGLLVPVLADACVVHLVGDDGQPRIAALHHQAGQGHFLRRWTGLIKMESAHPIAEVLRTCTPNIALASTPERILSGMDYAPEDIEHISHIIVPMTSRGQAIGAITLLSQQPGREYGESDLALVAELGRRAALAVENSRLYTQAQEDVRAREILLSVVSHDLRNLLAAVKGSSALMRRLALPAINPAELERAEMSLARIDGAVAKMHALIAELLDFAQLQAGQPLDLVRRRTDLLALAREVAAEYQEDSGRHQITVHTDLPELCGLWDQPRLERALDNLVSNAIKYSPAGGPITLDVSREQGADWAVLTVKDRGIGIPEADQPYVFDWFRRAGNVEGRIRGTGIGLASVRQVVEQHGGTISVESQEGEGSSFTLRLPLTVPTDAFSFAPGSLTAANAGLRQGGTTSGK